MSKSSDRVTCCCDFVDENFLFGECLNKQCPNNLPLERNFDEVEWPVYEEAKGG